MPQDNEEIIMFFINSFFFIKRIFSSSFQLRASVKLAFFYEKNCLFFNLKTSLVQLKDFGSNGASTLGIFNLFNSRSPPFWSVMAIEIDAKNEGEIAASVKLACFFFENFCFFSDS